MRSKGQILLNFNHKDFYTKFCVCPHKKDIKHIDRTIHSVVCVMHKWSDLGMLGVKNLGVEICDDAQSTARSSKQFLLNNYNKSSFVKVYDQ